MKHINELYDTKCSALMVQQVVHIIILEAEFDVRSGLVHWVDGIRSFYIHTYAHTYIHIHATDPVSASIASEYGTCQ